MTKLKVGDRLYGLNYGSISSVATVQRVTKTLAICKFGLKFNIELSGMGTARLQGDGQYDTTLWRLETPELKEMRKKQNAIYKLEQFDYSKLDTEALMQLVEIIAKHNEQ